MPIYDDVLAAIDDTVRGLSNYLADANAMAPAITEADVHGRVGALLGYDWRINTQGRKPRDTASARPDLWCVGQHAGIEFTSARAYAGQPANYAKNIAPEWQWLCTDTETDHRFLCILMDRHEPDCATQGMITGFGRHTSFTREHVGPLAPLLRQRVRSGVNAKTWWSPDHPGEHVPGCRVAERTFRWMFVGDPGSTMWAWVVDTGPVGDRAVVMAINDTPLPTI